MKVKHPALVGLNYRELFFMLHCCIGVPIRRIGINRRLVATSFAVKNSKVLSEKYIYLFGLCNNISIN